MADTPTPASWMDALTARLDRREEARRLAHEAKATENPFAPELEREAVEAVIGAEELRRAMAGEFFAMLRAATRNESGRRFLKTLLFEVLDGIDGQVDQMGDAILDLEGLVGRGERNRQ